MRPSPGFRSLRVPIAIALLSLGALSGCRSTSPDTIALKAPPTPADRPSPDLTSVTAALELMQTLPTGDPARQAELFAAAKQAATLTPTTSNKLKYSLALATPNHGGSDPVAAQRQLAQLLATPETLLPAERLLAMVELQEVDQWLVLQTEDAQIRDEAPREARDKLSALNKRLQAESDENARLRKALDEAQAKLDAVTHVERSINDRNTGGTHTP